MKKKYFLLFLLFVTIVFVEITIVGSISDYVVSLQSVYGSGSCATCHINPSGGGTRNDYGILFEDQPNHVADPETALQVIGAPPGVSPVPSATSTLHTPLPTDSPGPSVTSAQPTSVPTGSPVPIPTTSPVPLAPLVSNPIVTCYLMLRGTFTPGPTPVITVAPIPTPVGSQTPTPVPTGSPTPTPVPSITECSTNYCTLDIKEFRVNNNMWSDSSAAQSVYVDTINNKLGWTWNKPTQTEPNYPSVVVGTDFGLWNPSTAPSLFPILFKNVNTWSSEIEWKYLTAPTGLFNLGYDIYWMDSSFLTRHYNIMIWPYGDLGYLPPDGKVVSDGINDYWYYHESRFGWPWDGFILKNQVVPTQGTVYTYKVNIKALINTINNDQFTNNGDWVIPDIQLGNEVWNGEGKIEISRYNVELNGNTVILSS